MTDNCCEDECFSELVKCYREDGYLKAHGWTESTGQGGMFPYSPPAGWEYDPAFEDIRDLSTGTHGGCPNCVMTLVHLRKLSDEPEPSEPSKTPWLLLIAALIGLYLYLKKR